MDGFYGSERQRALQAKADAAAAARGAAESVAGRFRSTGDPRVQGWDLMDRILEEDGYLVLQMGTPEAVAQFWDWAAHSEATVHDWEVHEACTEHALRVCMPILSRELPSGLSRIEPKDMDDAALARVQRFVDGRGLAPFSIATLRGDFCPAATVAFEDAGGLAACAHATMRFDPGGPHARTAWVGLVAVREDLAGRGLGTRINAEGIHVAARELAAEKVAEYVGAANAASKAMIARCGLSPTERRTVLASRDAARFSR